MKVFVFTFIILFSFSVSYSQWVEQTSGITDDLSSVSAVDNNAAWVCGNNGTVLRTTNGGLNWLNASGAQIPPNLDLYNIFGIDANTAMVTGSDANTYVFKTVNGGTTWIQIFTQASGFIDCILMANPMIGFMYGDPVGGRWSLWGTITGGVTWDSTDFYIPQSGTEAGWNNSMFFDPIGGQVWFGTNNTRVYRTFNLLNWNAQQTTGQTNSYAVWFNSTMNGMTGGDSIMATTNGGGDWVNTLTQPQGSGIITGITGVSSNWWVTRLDSSIYYSPDNGSTWFTDYSAPSGEYTHIAKARTGSNIVMWAVRTGGGISRNEIPLGIAPVSNQIPSEYNLKQNYPNPFNPATSIRFDIPKSGNVRLVVFDELGREVSVLIEGELNAGSYKADFNGSSLSSGVYFYRITADDFTMTKKMILSK
jgi:Secretion system C-terminal sorting domain